MNERAVKPPNEQKIIKKTYDLNNGKQTVFIFLKLGRAKRTFAYSSLHRMQCLIRVYIICSGLSVRTLRVNMMSFEFRSTCIAGCTASYTAGLSHSTYKGNYLHVLLGGKIKHIYLFIYLFILVDLFTLNYRTHRSANGVDLSQYLQCISLNN